MQDIDRVGMPVQEYEMLCESHGSLIIDDVIAMEIEIREKRKLMAGALAAEELFLNLDELECST